MPSGSSIGSLAGGAIGTALFPGVGTAIGSGLGGLLGGLLGGGGSSDPNQIFGKKPKVAPFVPVDLSAETGKAVAGNLANYSSITDLLNQIIPGFSNMLGQGVANTQSELAGQIPTDVAGQVQRSAAEKALQGGYGGTGMAHALTARDLGLTSLNLTQMGNNSAQLWSNLAESAYSPFTVTTGQQAGTTAANNAGQQATQQYQNDVTAAANPAALGMFNVNTANQQQNMGYLMAGAGALGTPKFNYIPQTGQYSAPTTSGYGWSDRRLKKDILLMGTTSGGFNLYEFNYIWEEGPANLRHIGVLAQEVQEKFPEAVREIDGYLQVNYDMIGLPFGLMI